MSSELRNDPPAAQSVAFPNSICIATPTLRGEVKAAYLQGVFGLQRLCFDKGIATDLLVLAQVSVIAHARNVLVNQFLWTTACSHLLFIDDDMGFAANDLMAMFEWADHDVVGVIYPKKRIDWERIKKVVLAHPDIEAAQLAYLVGDYRDMFALPANAPTMVVGRKPMPVESIGTGVMMISRQCLMRLIETAAVGLTSSPLVTAHPVYNFFDFPTDQGQLMGEDYQFCSLVRRHSGTILGCPWPVITHSGNYDFVGDLAGIAAYS